MQLLGTFGATGGMRMSADKRIPVTEDTWKELHDLKDAGQTYDELLTELLQEHRERRLAERARSVREMDREELTSLDELRRSSESDG